MKATYRGWSVWFETVVFNRSRANGQLWAHNSFFILLSKQFSIISANQNFDSTNHGPKNWPFFREGNQTAFQKSRAHKNVEKRSTTSFRRKVTASVGGPYSGLSVTKKQSQFSVNGRSHTQKYTPYAKVHKASFQKNWQFDL